MSEAPWTSAQLMDLLENIEWAAGPDRPRCPSCDRPKGSEHRTDCQLAEFTEHVRTRGLPRLNVLAAEIVGINRANGWNVCTPADWADGPGAYKLGTVMALIHSEVSEALEAIRENDPQNFAEELADVLIRVLDCAGGLGIDLDEEVRRKLDKNRTRGYRHGGKAV